MCSITCLLPATESTERADETGARARPPARAHCNNDAASLTTSGAGAEQRVNALVAGFYIHLCKPIDAVELLHVVSALGRHARH